MLKTCILSFPHNVYNPFYNKVNHMIVLNADMSEILSCENTVGKGEIAHYEQFLLFPQCFQKTCTADT